MDRERVDQAVACFMNGFNCSQAVCSAFAEQYGLDRKTALKVSGAFGGGMAGTAGTCGAVTGGLMVIGLRHGKCEPEDEEAKQRCQAKGQEFLARFRERHSCLVCRDLLGCDISTPEGKLYHEVNQLKEKKCRGFVADAAEILGQLL